MPGALKRPATHSSGPLGMTYFPEESTRCPPAMVAETAGRCQLTRWCPQEQVLRHPAVGCFLTHNGWNSTCESIAAGVPMVCWSRSVDQFANCKYASDEWGIGVRLVTEVKREQVTKCVNEAMASEVLRVRTGRGREVAKDAACPGGSSYEDVLAMVRALHGSSPRLEA